LNLEVREVKVRLDKNVKPTHIEKIYYDISHQLIEEFMLAANEAVAKHICQLQVPCVYRIHEDPDLEKLKDFRVYAQSFGYKVGDVTHRQELQKLLKQVEVKPEEYAINLALLRSLKQARYSGWPRSSTLILHRRSAAMPTCSYIAPCSRYCTQDSVLPAVIASKNWRAIPNTSRGRSEWPPMLRRNRSS
jgi:hypothetical protein